MPLFTTYNILQRWNFTNLNGITGQLAVQYVNDRKDGGTLIQSLPTSYLYRTNSELLRVNGKTGFIFSDDHDQSIGIQWSLSRYRNSSQFDSREYNGDEQSGYINVLYQSSLVARCINSETGMSFMFDEYDETFDLMPVPASGKSAWCVL